ncbi:MAG: GMC family oxidoreductase [Myxococcales bacterium]|nr:GMC family oxidoreductase [Myxococcales bacterium]
MKPGPEHLDADYVVVGSGAAGATVAKTLSEAGYSVVLLEEGGPTSDTPFDADVWSTMRRLCRDNGSQMITGKALIPLLQGRCVGGSTVINSGICWRVPEDVHAEWIRTDPALGQTISYRDLNDHWEMIERDLRVSRVPENVLGGNNVLMRRGAEALGYRGHVIQRNVSGCQGSARCLQGCPTGSKQSVALTYIPDAVRAGAKLMPRHRVERIECKGNVAEAVSGTCVDADFRPTGRFFARAYRGVILAASAIQTPQLLQASGMGGSGPVGRHFMCHPGVSIVGLYEKPVDMWFGATQGFEVDEFRNHGIKIESLSLPPELLVLRLPGIGSKLQKYLENSHNMTLWGAQVRAKAQGTVSRGWAGTRVRYSPNQEDMAMFRLGLKVSAELCFAAGAHTILPGLYGFPEQVHEMSTMVRLLDGLTDVRQMNMIATHLFGTAKMGSDPRFSVVDTRFHSHTVSRLWIADSSTFPSNLGVNPQHTIMAMARQASHHILDASVKSR